MQSARVTSMQVISKEGLQDGIRPTTWDSRLIARTSPAATGSAFESVEDRLEPYGTSTLLTRRTTVFSYLHPSWYWRSFERLGIKSEHAYILKDVVFRSAPSWMM